MEQSKAVGLTCCLVAGVFFGSNYLPVKKVNVGDGIFFSVCMSIGIMLVGVLVNFTLADRELPNWPHAEGPRFEWRAAVGGATWMLGNFACPIVVRWIGLGLGLATWDCANLLTGWAAGAFGLFGLQKEELSSPHMNRFGVVLACASLVVLALACEDEVNDVAPACGATAASDATRTDLDDGGGKERADEDVPELFDLGYDSSVEAASDATTEATDGAKSKATLAETARRIGLRRLAAFPQWRTPAGFILALLVGILFGLTFDWPTKLMEEGEMGDKRHSTNAMDYVFSQFVGILLMGIVVLMVYLAVMRGESFLPWNIVLPAIASGVMWGVAQVAWFQANELLTMSIAFPIISTLPGVIAMLWGYFAFGEFRTSRVRKLALFSIAIRVPAVLLISMSDSGLPDLPI